MYRWMPCALVDEPVQSHPKHVEKCDNIAGRWVRAKRSHYENNLVDGLEVWPESHWPGFALRQTDVL